MTGLIRPKASIGESKTGCGLSPASGGILPIRATAAEYPAISHVYGTSQLQAARAGTSAGRARSHDAAGRRTCRPASSRSAGTVPRRHQPAGPGRHSLLARIQAAWGRLAYDRSPPAVARL